MISAGDQTLLRDRKDNQQSIERLYGFGFPEMWRGQIDDGTIARGDQTIVYDTGALQGTFVFANLVTDLLLFVGSSAGADDKGRRRILSISGVEASGTIIVDWNDDIDWQDDDHLTIVHFFPPWARYSWFTATGPDFRKDGPPSGSGGAGVDYTDQNEEPPPLVIMGPHFAGELSAGTLAVQLSAANSQAVADGAAISSFAWAAVPTASVSFDNAAIAAPIVTFTADNTKYWLACTVTDDNGKSSIGYRSYQIGGAITEFSRGPITENYDNPSVSATLTLTSPETTDSNAIRPVMTWADFADKTLVVITSEDQYGATQKTITFRDAAQYEDHNHILYVGYLFAENDDLIDDGSGTVTLNAVSTIPMFLYSISLTGVENATDWFEMNKELMTVAANLFHLFKYQSTLLEIMDWHLPFTDTVLRSANEEFNEGSLVDRARALAGARLMAITAIGLGEVWVETDLNLRSSADRTAETTTLTMTDSDVSGTKRARVRQYGDNIRAILDGGSSFGLLGSFTPFLSASTFIATAEGRPQMVNFPRLMLPSQTEANRLAGRIATVANGKFQEVNLELSGNYRAVFSPGDQQKVDLGNTFAGSLQANIRGYTDLEDADVIVRTMTHNHNNGFTSVSIVADIMQAEGLTGVTITPPAVPPDAIEPGAGAGNFDLPSPPNFPPVPPNEAVAGAAVGVDEDDGVYWTLDSGSTWEARSGGLSTAGGADIIWDPWWFTAFENNSSNPEDVILQWSGLGYIRRSINAGKNWTDLTAFVQLTGPPNSWNDVTPPVMGDVNIKQVHGDIHKNKRFVAIGAISDGVEANARGWLLISDDNWTTTVWTQLAPGFGDVTYDFVTGDEQGWANDAAHSRPFGVFSAGVGWLSVWASVPGPGFDERMSLIRDIDNIGGIITGVEVFYTTIGFVGTAPVIGILVNDITRISGPFTAPNTFSQAVTGLTDAITASTTVRTSMVGGAGPLMDGDLDVTITKIIVTQETTLIPLAIDVDVETGTQCYVTLWQSGNLVLQVWDITSTTPTFTRSFIIGAATLAQVEAHTFFVVPYTPAFFGTASFGDIVYIFGVFPGNVHIRRSTDAGVTFGADIGDGTWGAAEVGGFFADDASTLYAFVNGGARALWRSLDGGTSWTNLSTLPFDVDYDAVSKHADGRILIANQIAGAQMVAYADSPDYSSWVNATGSPAFSTTGGGARAIVWVT